MKRALILILIFAAIALAQELPLAPVIDDARIRREVADLYLQVSAYKEWVGSLQRRIIDLQTENADLKDKLKKYEEGK